MSFQSLTALDNYTEGELIGQGSFGIIHKVTRKSDGMVSQRPSSLFTQPHTLQEISSGPYRPPERRRWTAIGATGARLFGSCICVPALS